MGHPESARRLCGALTDQSERRNSPLNYKHTSTIFILTCESTDDPGTDGKYSNQYDGEPMEDDDWVGWKIILCMFYTYTSLH